MRKLKLRLRMAWLFIQLNPRAVFWGSVLIVWLIWFIWSV